jgi:5-methyltetrahydropteroyltriglutamate--homocysteine methyltransferase
MQLNVDRILTTHTGSLPRPPRVVDLLFMQDRGEPVDPQAFEETLAAALDSVIAKQIEAGIDVVGDGEIGKISYATYVRHRLTGFDGDSPRPTPQDLDDFPSLRDRLVAQGASPTYRRPVCTGPVNVKDTQPVQRDIARLKAAVGRASIAGAFLTSVSPGTVALFHPNGYYPTHEAYIQALAAAMRPEYEAVIGAGLLLQVDCPDLAMGRHTRFKHLSESDFVRHAHVHIEALNEALRGLPADRMRLHVCWGNYEGPHTHDIPLRLVLPVVLKARPAMLLIEGANPRHEHEWEVWSAQRLPDDKALIAGVIDTSTNFVEHPELVAQRIVRFANLLGRERVGAGTDCGLGSFAGFGPVDPEIAWIKLRALSQGASVASERLWRPGRT